MTSSDVVRSLPLDMWISMFSSECSNSSPYFLNDQLWSFTLCTVEFFCRFLLMSLLLFNWVIVFRKTVEKVDFYFISRILTLFHNKKLSKRVALKSYRDGINHTAGILLQGQCYDPGIWYNLISPNCTYLTPIQAEVLIHNQMRRKGQIYRIETVKALC